MDVKEITACGESGFPARFLGEAAAPPQRNHLNAGHDVPPQHRPGERRRSRAGQHRRPRGVDPSACRPRQALSPALVEVHQAPRQLHELPLLTSCTTSTPLTTSAVVHLTPCRRSSRLSWPCCLRQQICALPLLPLPTIITTICQPIIPQPFPATFRLLTVANLPPKNHLHASSLSKPDFLNNPYLLGMGLKTDSLETPNVGTVCHRETALLRTRPKGYHCRLSLDQRAAYCTRCC